MLRCMLSSPSSRRYFYVPICDQADEIFGGEIEKHRKVAGTIVRRNQ